MSKSKLKQEKPVETLEEFVQRVNQQSSVKRNGLKKNYVWQKRRHSA